MNTDCDIYNGKKRSTAGSCSTQDDTEIYRGNNAPQNDIGVEGDNYITENVEDDGSKEE